MYHFVSFSSICMMQCLFLQQTTRTTAAAAAAAWTTHPAVAVSSSAKLLLLGRTTRARRTTSSRATTTSLHLQANDDKQQQQQQQRQDTTDYRQLFLNDTPLMDVRAPVEFSAGSFPTATNIPLLDNTQRQLVGTCYKEQGQEAAIALGNTLATPEIRKERLQSWTEFCKANPTGYLYCFRGGLRSHTVQEWLLQQQKDGTNNGVDYPLVQGGSKAMRRFLMDSLQESTQQVPMVVVGGNTGVGKTRALHKLEHCIDFEGIANHRGSAFGANVHEQQPSVIDWENKVAVEFLQHGDRFPGVPVFVEDEGRRIGNVQMPEHLFAAIQEAPMAVLELDLEARIQILSEDYIIDNWPRYQQVYGEEGAGAGAAETAFTSYVLGSLARIERRLGGKNYQQVKQSFESGLRDLYSTGGVDEFNPGFHVLLEQYYDPMYNYQMEKRKPNIVFQGPEAELVQWAAAAAEQRRNQEA